ncbi:uncharacterized protein PB18E9.04c-like [Lytechinus variegatus]|uniref:uncharacterized protein PB18E9.04c-like n=1 Tax=Lytechinus variegatus TaxID=7654 RepID=UPI001BB15FF6|nr:uncharacterized protein PB18E9.04c-like [Lytechinus variegatus]
MTSPSLSTSQWLSTPDGKEGSTTFDGAPDGTATPTTPPLTDVFLQPTSQVSTSPTRVTIQPITEPQDPITPNKVSLVCDEVDRTLSVVECATPNECTINIFVCDGVSDCSDGSDESPATCLGEPACEHEPKLVCENGGTCLSKPRTSQKVAHVTCLCELNFRGETCLEEVDLTTSSSPLSPTPLASTLLSISQSAASTVENTPATVSVTQNTEGTQNTVVSLTTEITSTVIETSRDIEVSSSLTTNPVTRTISNSPAIDEPTTENAEVMSPSKDVTSGKSYTTATEVVTSYDTALTTIVFPSTSQELTTDTNPISESSGTSVSRITTPLPFTSDTETQTWTPKSPPTSDITIITEDVPLVSDMTTDHLTTEYEEFTIITEIITIPVSNTDDVTNVNTDTATGEGLGTESSAITEVSTQLLSLRTSTMMIPTVDPSQTITYFEKESTETVTTFDETTDTSTTNERQLATDSATDIGTTESTLGDTTISGVDESQAYSTSTPFEVIGTQSDITSTKESSDYPTTMEGTRTFERETDYPMKRTTEASGTQSDITVMVSDGKTSHTVGKATEASSSTESDTTIYTRSTEYPMVKTTETSSTQSDASISSEGTTDYKMVKTTEASTITIDTTTENTNTHIDMSSVTSLQSAHPSTTQATLSIETTTELITTHADTQTSGLDPTDDSKTQRTSTVTLTSLLLSTSAIQTTDRKASTTEEEGDQGTHFGSTTDQNTVTSSRFETSKIFSTTDTSSSTTAGRSASSERVVLIVLLSTAAVIVFSIACLILVGCCIARKWREKNFYPDDDQTPLRSPQTYSQQSNRGKKYTYGQNHQENNKPSFAHRLKPFQSTKVEYESDLTDAPSLSSPSPTTLSIINDYFEQMHSVYNGLEPDGNRNNSTERHYEGTDLGSESFEMRFFPDTEYWMPSSSSDVTDIPYYITDDAPLPVSHV